MDNTGRAYKEQVYEERGQKFWSLYVKESGQHDRNVTETWKADMDSTLIFAGLFSAAVTAFLVDSYKLLQPDSSDETRDLLKQILAVQIVEASLNTSAISLPSTMVTAAFSPSASAIAVNLLWFLSLSCSLATALSVTLVQQWIRDYLQKIEKTNQPQRRATVRGIMFYGTGKWKLNSVVEYIPILLHFSLFFFFVGLCTFLWNINKIIAGFLAFMVVCCLAFYAFATVAPLIDRCAPYETPLSTLLWYLQRRAMCMIRRVKDENKSLSEVRDGLASRPADENIHEIIHAVSWVYDRTSDDRELQEFAASIPGLLSTQDGQVAWRVFSRSEGSFEGLETRIVQLLKSSAVSYYLEPTTRHLRATDCIDALLALASTPEFFKSTGSVELDSIIMAPWENNELTTKFVCAKAIFRHRALLTELLSIQHHPSYRSFRQLSTKADEALRDVDSLREILEDLLKEPERSLRSHQAEIVTLLKVYFGAVESKTSVLERWIEEMSQILPEQYPLLSWYASLTPRTWEFSLRKNSALEHAENFIFKPMALHIVGHLRLHGAYSPIPSVSADYDNQVELAANIAEYADHWQTFFSETTSLRRLFGGSGDTDHSFQTFLQYNEREAQPLLSLFGILDGEWQYDTNPPAGQPPQTYPSCHLMSLIAEDKEGPFSLLATILDAMVEDQGTIGGLLILIMMLKHYKAGPPFEPFVIYQCLETICPYMINHDNLPMTKGSQVILVLSLLEILIWEREDSDTPHSFPLKSMADALVERIADLSDEVPVLMAERAFGTTYVDRGNPKDFRTRAYCVSARLRQRSAFFTRMK